MGAQPRGADAGDQQQGRHRRKGDEQVARHAAHALGQSLAQRIHHIRPGEPGGDGQRNARRGHPALKFFDELVALGVFRAAQPHQDRNQDHR
ncbi:hypothetical protein G6F63_016427 [Rhizopus arrhizus]|nr:hypothetical protein G6F68_015017 [Rhizopus microsporus]KAG1309293.1 hypothetical protein G6F63_016427 [Rhizopus arrhizus]